jgi:hypothetical protein
MAGNVVALHLFLEPGYGRLHRGLVGAGEFAAVLAQHFFDVVNEVVSLVASFGQFAATTILGRVGFGFFAHAFDFGLGQAAGRFDTNLLFLTRGQITGRDMQDAVVVHLEGNFDLRHAPRGWRNAFEVELGQQTVISGHFALALEHADGNCCLVIFGSGENLLAGRRDGGVALDDFGEHATQRFETERERHNVQQEHFRFAPQQELVALDGGTYCDDFIRVNAFVSFFPEDFPHQLLDARHSGHTADEHHFVNVAGFQTSIA